MQLLRQQPDGQPLHAHLRAAAAATGRPDPRLTRAVPPAGAALWDAWCQLAGSRPPTMGGPAGVPLSEIEAWQALNRIRFTGWELDTLVAMDRAAVAAMNEKQGGAP
jgi:hypothetical protein